MNQGIMNSFRGVSCVIMRVVLILLVNIGYLNFSHAGDIGWSGYYRAEGIFIKNLTLDKNAGIENSYILNHLVLKPKIIATDGLNIKARFDIFNNSISNNQAGAPLGDYSGTQTSSTSTQGTPSAIQSTAQESQTIAVNELYMDWIHEFGALVIGRVPFEFGLGMAYNAGNGPFDHWLSTKDLVAYKIVMGNITITPAYGKVRESALTSEDDINDYIVTAEYSNPETDFAMGFLFDSRVAPRDAGTPSRGNDFPASNFGSAAQPAILYDGYQAYNMNFFVKKNTDNFNLGAELGFLNGYSGVKIQTPSGLERVEMSGFGLAGQFGYRTGSLTLNLLAGVASGDDPDTARFEGYFFSPNYDIAMMMFNHALGQYDLLKTNMAGSRVAQVAGVSNPASRVSELGGLDTEVISNAIYFAPNIKLALGEKYDLLGTVAYATLQKPATSAANGNVGNSIGFEADLGINYHPTDKFMWSTTMGFLFPGSAWTGTPGQNFRNDFAYGLTSKAAINF
ncbi:MAG: hypothetical protein SGI74_01405 [Oligoflexia bacterium]|nr:hypothetical protein [Oligoflexia bacterium]